VGSRNICSNLHPWQFLECKLYLLPPVRICLPKMTKIKLPCSEKSSEYLSLRPRSRACNLSAFSSQAWAAIHERRPIEKSVWWCPSFPSDAALLSRGSQVIASGLWMKESLQLQVGVCQLLVFSLSKSMLQEHWFSIIAHTLAPMIFWYHLSA